MTSKVWYVAGTQSKSVASKVYLDAAAILGLYTCRISRQQHQEMGSVRSRSDWVRGIPSLPIQIEAAGGWSDSRNFWNSYYSGVI